MVLDRVRVRRKMLRFCLSQASLISLKSMNPLEVWIVIVGIICIVLMCSRNILIVNLSSALVVSVSLIQSTYFQWQLIHQPSVSRSTDRRKVLIPGIWTSRRPSTLRLNLVIQQVYRASRQKATNDLPFWSCCPHS